MDASARLAAMAEEAGKVHTMSGSGTLELTQANGQSVRLDMAVVLELPQRARIQAFKFGSKVFDLTVLPSGVWLESSNGSGSAQRNMGTTAAPVGKAWSLVGGDFFTSRNLLTTFQGKWMIVRGASADQPTIVCRIDRDTLTARRYQIIDTMGKVRFTLDLDHYEDFNGAVWPRRIVAISEAGTIAVDLTEVELNGEIAPLAFKPPLRAEKLP